MITLHIRYKYYKLTVHASESNTNIIDSYQVKTSKDMKHILKLIRKDTLSDYAVHKRSLFSMINEWRGHNLVYGFNIEPNRTKDVDLGIKTPWYAHLIYFILSPFYFHF